MMRGTMTELVTRPRVDVALPDDEVEWIECAVDRTSVVVAVDELAAAFGLGRLEEGCWQLRPAGPEVVGIVVIRSDDTTRTSVGLWLRPALDHHLGCLPTVIAFFVPTTIWCVLLFTDLLAGITARGVFLLAPPLFMVPAVLASRVTEARRRRRALRWISGWRGRFLPALAERVEKEQPYR